MTTQEKSNILNLVADLRGLLVNQNQNQNWRVQSYRKASPIRKSQMLYDLRKRFFPRGEGMPHLNDSDLEKLYNMIVNAPIKSIEDLLSLGLEAQWLSGLGIDEVTLMKLVDAVWQNPRVNPTLTTIERRSRINQIFKSII